MDHKLRAISAAGCEGQARKIAIHIALHGDPASSSSSSSSGESTAAKQKRSERRQKGNWKPAARVQNFALDSTDHGSRINGPTGPTLGGGSW